VADAALVTETHFEPASALGNLRRPSSKQPPMAAKSYAAE
jgi:hypothetical protein